MAVSWRYGRLRAEAFTGASHCRHDEGHILRAALCLAHRTIGGALYGNLSRATLQANGEAGDGNHGFAAVGCFGLYCSIVAGAIARDACALGCRDGSNG